MWVTTTPLPSRRLGGCQLCVLTSRTAGTAAAEQTEVQLQHSDLRTGRAVSVTARDEQRKKESAAAQDARGNLFHPRGRQDSRFKLTVTDQVLVGSGPLTASPLPEASRDIHLQISQKTYRPCSWPCEPSLTQVFSGEKKRSQRPSCEAPKIHPILEI